MSAVRVAVALLGALLAGFGALALALTALFEVNGLGGDRDSGPAPLLLAGCLLGVAACVVATIALWRWLVPEGWLWGPVVLGAAFAVGVVVLGIFA